MFNNALRRQSADPAPPHSRKTRPRFKIRPAIEAMEDRLALSGVQGATVELGYDSKGLLAQDTYGHLDWSDIAPDGADPVNAAWESGERSTWYIEQQRTGATLIIGGIVHNNPTAIQEGIAMFDWGFAHQSPDGGFDGSSDEFHSTAFFVEAVAHACLVLEASPYAAQYASQVAQFTADDDRAAQWMITPSILSRGEYDDLRYTHREYLDADALGETSLLANDPTLMPAARQFIQTGISLQQPDGVNPELGGHDSSYQGVGLVYAERWETYFPNDPLDPDLDHSIIKGLEWEETMILPTGEISTAGNTRTAGQELNPSGTVKTVAHVSVETAFAYRAAVNGSPRWEADALKISHFYEPASSSSSTSDAIQNSTVEGPTQPSTSSSTSGSIQDPAVEGTTPPAISSLTPVSIGGTGIEAPMPPQTSHRIMTFRHAEKRAVAIREHDSMANRVSSMTDHADLDGVTSHEASYPPGRSGLPTRRVYGTSHPR
jgi:hypothetical protein